MITLEKHHQGTIKTGKKGDLSTSAKTNKITRPILKSTVNYSEDNECCKKTLQDINLKNGCASFVESAKNK